MWTINQAPAVSRLFAGMWMSRSLIAILLPLTALRAQAPPPPAVFTQFSPTIIRMTTGPAQCTIWAHLAPPYPWDTVGACYINGVLASMKVGNMATSPIALLDVVEWCNTGPWSPGCMADPNGLGGTISYSVRPWPGLTPPATLSWQMGAAVLGSNEATLRTGTF